MTGNPKSDPKAKPHEAKHEFKKAEQDEELEQELEDLFPASDPPSLTQPEVGPGAPDHKGGKPKGKK